MTRLHDLYTEQKQSIWLDFIGRDIIDDGTMSRLIKQGLRGVTSNPTIFDKAISGSALYDDTIAELVAAGADTFGIYDAVSQSDVAAAADMLRGLYDASDGGDGYVSIEVSPELAYDTEATLAEARRIWASLVRPNIMIKVPATAEGKPAIRQLIGDGINVNATLMFSLQDYDNVAFAYVDGLEDLVAQNRDPAQVASVASFFVSRIDGVVDGRLNDLGNTVLQGKIAIANAKLAYARFEEVFAGPRWQALAAKGARYQRPLWASTSTKNPDYLDVLYVDNLIGPHTVNTLPQNTLEATLEHTVVACTIDQGVADARAQIDALAALGIDFTQVTSDLQSAGVKSFADSFQSLLDTIAQRAATL